MKIRTKALALVLSLIMICSVAAIAEGTDDIMTPYGPYPETVTMTTVKRSDTNPQWSVGDDVDNNVVTRYILEKINVKTETLWETESSAFIEKLTLDIVADNLPDMFTLDNDDYLVYRMLLENGMIADLTEPYDKCANWFLRETAESFDYKHFEPYTEDGRIMAIPTGRYGYEHNQLWVRTSALEDCGMTADDLTTLEGIEAFLTKCKELYPDTLGLALNATDPLTNYGVSYSAEPIAEAFGATPRYWLKGDDGAITYGSIMPGMKDALTVLADWYQKGLIDKEFATRTGNGQTDAIMNGGQAVACFAPWWWGWTGDAIAKNGTLPEGTDVHKIWTVINGPVDSEGKFNAPWPSVAGTTLFVSAKCATPEAAIKILNVEYDQGRGFDAEAYAIYEDDGVDSPNPAGLRDVGWGYLNPTGYVNMEYADVVPRYGHGIVRYIESNGEDTSGFNMPAQENESATVLRGVQGPDYTVGLGTYFSRVVAAPLTDAENVEFVYPAFSQVTESMADLLPSLQTLEQTFVLQVIMGQRSVDDFDAFVEQWLAEGGQTLIDEVTALVD
ncbi:MAG: hypothetical protein IJJ23_04130 [Clostridia bacterium]|nr:hypothetical protein [Clostridia bacterium]